MSEPTGPKPPPSDPRTAEDYFEVSAYYAGRAHFHKTMEEDCRRQSENALRVAEGMRAREEALTTERDSDTVNAMNATAISADALRSATRSAYKDNKFVQAKTANGETIGDIVALLKKQFPSRRFHQNVIQGWYVPVGEKSHRDCPIEVREFLRDYYGKYTSGPHKGAWRVPLDSWPLERGR